MRPEERGRFCAACSKTVVDFSMMTDQEVVQYLARAGSGVCGRFIPEQLGRDMALPGVPGRRRRNWWHWLVAGLLVTAEARGQAPGKVKIEQKAGSGKTEMGKYLTGDTILFTVPKKIDTIKVKELPTVTVVAYSCTTTGGMIVTAVRKKKIIEKAVDTLAAVGLLPKPELRVYPNPARRGTVVTLDWRQTEAGQYEVGLYNTAGSLVEQHIMEVGGKG